MWTVDSHAISGLNFKIAALFLLQILETEKELKWQQELLSNEKIKAEEREEHLLKVQRQSEILEDSLTNKVRSSGFGGYCLPMFYHWCAKLLLKTKPAWLLILSVSLLWVLNKHEHGQRILYKFLYWCLGIASSPHLSLVTSWVGHSIRMDTNLSDICRLNIIVIVHVFIQSSKSTVWTVWT